MSLQYKQSIRPRGTGSGGLSGLKMRLPGVEPPPTPEKYCNVNVGMEF